MCATDSTTIMEIRSKELASVAKAQKNTQKKHKKRDSHRLAPRQAIETTRKKPKQARPLNQKAQQSDGATAITTTIDGTDVVSFIDEKDTMREAKKKKKIQIHAKRQSTIRQEKDKKKKKKKKHSTS